MPNASDTQYLFIFLVFQIKREKKNKLRMKKETVPEPIDRFHNDDCSSDV